MLLSSLNHANPESTLQKIYEACELLRAMTPGQTMALTVLVLSR